MNLAKTQRDVIRQHNEADGDLAFNPFTILPETEDQDAMRGTETGDPGKVRKRKIPLWLKIIAAVICLAILIGGVIVLVWYFKQGSDEVVRGSIVPPLEKKSVCADVFQSVGNSVEFTCDISTDANVTAEFANKVAHGDAKFNCTRNGANVTCELEKVSCSTFGKILVSYNNVSNQRVTEELDLSIIETLPVTTITNNYDSLGELQNFTLTCAHYGSCVNYRMVFYAGQHRLTENMTCTSTYGNDVGHRTTCQATIPSDVIYKYGNGSELTCQLQKDDGTVNMEKFVFPKCTDYAINDPKCRRGSDLFRCDAGDQFIDCGDACTIINTCFSSRSQQIVNFSGTVCSSKCALTWCREDGSKILDKSGKIPFEKLCNDQIL